MLAASRKKYKVQPDSIWRLAKEISTEAITTRDYCFIDYISTKLTCMIYLHIKITSRCLDKQKYRLTYVANIASLLLEL
jgi:hypothetical protein